MLSFTPWTKAPLRWTGPKRLKVQIDGYADIHVPNHPTRNEIKVMSRFYGGMVGNR